MYNIYTTVTIPSPTFWILKKNTASGTCDIQAGRSGNLFFSAIRTRGIYSQAHWVTWSLERYKTQGNVWKFIFTTARQALRPFLAHVTHFPAIPAIGHAKEGWVDGMGVYTALPQHRTNPYPSQKAWNHLARCIIFMQTMRVPSILDFERECISKSSANSIFICLFHSIAKIVFNFRMRIRGV